MAEKKTEGSAKTAPVVEKEETTPPVPEKPKSKPQYRIETQNGIYTVKRPSGRIGAKHFSLLAKSIPAGRDEEGNVLLSPGDQERFGQVFEEWCIAILPHLIVDGPFKYDEMPGEDQYAIFLAMFNLMNMGSGELFRILG